MRKNVCTLTIVSFISISLVSIFEIKQNANFLHANGECEHFGYHYEELLPEIEIAGHKEFWTCCKCHEEFLEKPENGAFVDQEDALMTGEIDEGHIAYISPIELKSLMFNGRRYYPALHESGELEGITFYDANKNEIAINHSEDPMSDLGNAMYYVVNGESTTFWAVSLVENVSYNDVYGTDTYAGAKLATDIFKKENDISSVEVIEKLTFSPQPSYSEKPIINYVALNHIWNSYRDYGFNSYGNAIWSCVAHDQTLAYYWDLNAESWTMAIRDFKKASVCLSRMFF